MTLTIQSEARSDTRQVLDLLMPDAEDNYKNDLAVIFTKQSQLVIYPQGQASALKFAGTDYIHPWYYQLYEQETVINSKPVHPSLVSDMHSLLQKHDTFLRFKKRLYAYAVRWYSMWFRENKDLSYAYNLKHSFPSNLKAAISSQIFDGFKDYYPHLYNPWFTREKEEHEFFSTMYLKQQLLRQ